MNRIMSIKNTAKRLGLSYARISQLLKDGILEAVEFEGRKFVSVESIEDFEAIKKQQQELRAQLRKKRDQDALLVL